MHSDGLTPGSDERTLPERGGDPFPLGRATQFVPPDLCSLLCQRRVVSPLVLSPAGRGQCVPGHADLLCAPARGRRYTGGYCVLEPGPVLCLYGVSRRAQPSTTSPALSDGLLSADCLGWGLRWPVCRRASTACL